MLAGELALLHHLNQPPVPKEAMDGGRGVSSTRVFRVADSSPVTVDLDNPSDGGWEYWSVFCVMGVVVFLLVALCLSLPSEGGGGVPLRNTSYLRKELQERETDLYRMRETHADELLKAERIGYERGTGRLVEVNEGLARTLVDQQGQLMDLESRHRALAQFYVENMKHMPPGTPLPEHLLLQAAAMSRPCDPEHLLVPLARALEATWVAS